MCEIFWLSKNIHFHTLPSHSYKNFHVDKYLPIQLLWSKQETIGTKTVPSNTFHNNLSLLESMFIV